MCFFLSVSFWNGQFPQTAGDVAVYQLHTPETGRPGYKTTLLSVNEHLHPSCRGGNAFPTVASGFSMS